MNAQEILATDARMAHALEWLRALAKPCSAEEREMLNSIEEAIAGVADTGNPKHAWDFLIAATRAA